MLGGGKREGGRWGRGRGLETILLTLMTLITFQLFLHLLMIIIVDSPPLHHSVVRQSPSNLLNCSKIDTESDTDSEQNIVNQVDV